MKQDRLSLISFFIYSLVFVFIVWIGKPAYYSKEDAFILYLLGGGFGSPTSVLLHYNHIMSPLINVVLKTFFDVFEGVNWYTFALFLMHYIAGAAILSVLLERTRRREVMWVFFAIQVIFQGWLMVHIGFTSVAIILTIAGIALLVGGRNRVYAFIFLVAASLFRLHVMIPLFGIALPYLFFKDKIFNRGNLAFLFLLIVSIFAMGLVQKWWYSSNIPGWSDEESYRQLIYGLYNKSGTTSFRRGDFQNELDLVRMGLPADSAYISRVKLLELNRAIEQEVQNRRKGWSEWFWINNRLYFVTALMLVLLFCLKNGNRLLVVMISALLMVFGCWLLAVHAKLPEYLPVACLFVFTLLTIIHLELRIDFWFVNYVIIIATSILMLWGAVRLYKLGIRNNIRAEEFCRNYSIYKKYPEHLFINTMGTFRLESVPVWSDPREYPLPNYLDSDHFLMNLHWRILQRFGLNSFSDVPGSDKVLFWGRPKEALSEYFSKVNGGKKTGPLNSKDSTINIFSIHFVNKAEH
ncbi:hypothetical protein [Flavihumibacter solisilvae]|uniref:Glycosyltransferase RgtA/B/C/D-like domain-containing protein n=1 Tax=Flavihumibacter solisilvae TaxID=1349421 RepID=A0A0C1LDA8_9BACT|nr:hypothetical protein [Flavihumibacter solisilvae]KIC93468.1 hypothetical protein OI18_17050 [Flavihumibacter solisilvae]